VRSSQRRRYEAGLCLGPTEKENKLVWLTPISSNRCELSIWSASMHNTSKVSFQVPALIQGVFSRALNATSSPDRSPPTRTSPSHWGRNTPRTDLPCSGSPLTGSTSKDVGAAGTQTARVERQYCSSLPKYQCRTAKRVLGLRSVERRMGVRSRVILGFRAAHVVFRAVPCLHGGVR
jgi:hypothetical protein